MTFIDKIPPMISAVAFGYGVGMAAPQSAMDSMQGAVDGVSRPVTQQYVAAPVYPAGMRPVAWRGPIPNAGPDGIESAELAELRRSGGFDGRHPGSCSLHQPTYSSPERMDNDYGHGGGVEVDLLDEASEQALSRLQLPDLKVSISRETLKYVRYFTKSDRGRGMFQAWLKRSGRYQELVSEELRRRELPEDLLWVSMIESGFDPRAKSPMGAVGLWQFMPATGRVYGLRQTAQVDQRKNPRLATQAAAHHLRDLYMRFGHWDLALAAYNMGYEQLLDRIDRYGTSDFNELARQGALPSETAKYVPKIVAAAIVANNLERFGYEEVKFSAPVDGAEIAVAPRTPLKTLAQAAGVSTSEIRKLNPDILGDRVPAGRGDFLLMIPAETLARAQAALPAMVRRSSDVEVLDEVDLLGGSEPAFTRDVADSEANLLSLLPRYKPKNRRSMRDSVPDRDTLAFDNPNDDDDRAEADSARLERRGGRETLMYRVGSGDTMIGVARTFGLDIEDVARDNGLSPKEKLREGALLKLQVRPDLIDDAPSLDAFRTREGARPAKRRSERYAG